MATEAAEPQASLAEILHARALATIPSRLALDLAGGTLVAATALWARPSGWVVIASAALCFSMYGLWAICERRLQTIAWDMPALAEHLWRATRASAAVLGLIGFVALLLSLLGVALGPIIS